jgi:hypothetical protein
MKLEPDEKRQKRFDLFKRQPTENGIMTAFQAREQKCQQ